MLKEVTKMIDDINNLTYILLEFTKNIEQTEDINAITTLAHCINEKTKKLYLILNK